MFEPVDLESLSAAGRIDLLVDVAREMARLEALTYRTLAVLDRDAERQAVAERPTLGAFADARDSIREEIALALRVPSTMAGARIETARRLVDDLPDTVQALSLGVITPAHARVLVDAVDGLDPQVARAVEARVLPRAGRQTVANFRRCLRRAVAPPLCRRHHRVKHRTGWHLQRHDNGDHHWTTPTGHTYLDPVPELPS